MASPRSSRLPWLAVAVLAGLAAAFLVATFMDPWQEAVPVDEVRSEGVVYLPGPNVFLVDDEGEVVALGGWSPHTPDRAEKVLFCRSSEQFVGAHGERFDIRGSYFAGPAPRGLAPVSLKVEGGMVYVDPGRVGTGADRTEAALEPAGRFCAEDADEAEPGFLESPT